MGFKINNCYYKYSPASETIIAISGSYPSKDTHSELK